MYDNTKKGLRKNLIILTKTMIIALLLRFLYRVLFSGKFWLFHNTAPGAHLAWISNYIHNKVLDEITYPFLNFNGTTVEV